MEAKDVRESPKERDLWETVELERSLRDRKAQESNRFRPSVM
jgi:hypothetical protein